MINKGVLYNEFLYLKETGHKVTAPTKITTDPSKM